MPMRRDDKQSSYHMKAHSLTLVFLDRTIRLRVPLHEEQLHVDDTHLDLAMTIHSPNLALAGSDGRMTLCQPDLTIEINEVFPDANATP